MHELRKGKAGWERGVMLGWERGGSLRNHFKSFDTEAEERPFDCSEEYMDCDFRGLFVLK